MNMKLSVGIVKENIGKNSKWRSLCTKTNGVENERYRTYIRKISNCGLSYLDNGVESDQTILMLHAFPLDARMFKHQLQEKTLLQNYKMISPDLPGFGESPSLDISKDEDARINHYTESVLKFMDSIGIKKSVLIGCDFGGNISLDLAVKSPERFSNLVLSNVMMKESTHLNQTFTKLIESYLKDKSDFKEAFPHFAAKWGHLFSEMLLFLKDLKVREVEEWLAEQSPKMKGNIQGLSAFVNMGDQTSLLSNLKIPTLLVAGDSDGYAPHANLWQYKNMIKSPVKISTISYSSHLTPFDSSHDFNRTVEYLLKKI